MNEACLGPDSNRHGVSPKGFSYQLQLSLLHVPNRFPCICGLDFTFAIPCAHPACTRLRQGPSSLYTFPGPEHETHQVRSQSVTRLHQLIEVSVDPGLARYCSHPDVLLFHRL